MKHHALGAFAICLGGLFFLASLNVGAQRAQRNSGAFDPSGAYYPRKGTYPELDKQIETEATVSPLVGTVLYMRLEKRRGGRYTGLIEIVRVKGGGGGGKESLWQFVSLTVTTEIFGFVTNQIRGVHYTFAGKFKRGGDFERQAINDEFGELKNALEGTLLRMKNGQKEWEKFIKFDYHIAED
jgi:hypothetical protein